jgi:serine/threonine protein kinase
VLSQTFAIGQLVTGAALCAECRPARREVSCRACGRLRAVQTIEAGQRYGVWVVTGDERLGGGGNGEVWRAEASDGRTGAVKVLHAGEGDEGQYRLARFKDEIGFLLAHPDFPGILPLLDSRISDNLDESSWYVMPVATPVRQALGADPGPDVVVGAAAEIADTLVALAAEGVAHRDIKPDNLFELDGRWVIGDFGLVTYPEKDPRTEHGRKVGPTDYMAPEMRRDADRADPGPADVWALAKTVWVLLTGQDLPLPGTHRSAEAAHSLQERITFRYAPELDRLLESATQIEPEKRISMRDMALELRACTVPPPEARESASLAELHDRMAALTAASRQRVSRTQDRRSRIVEAKVELEQIVADTAIALSDQLTFDIRSQENGYQAAALLGMPPYSVYDGDSWGWLLLPPGQQRPAVEVIVAAAYRMLDEDGAADIAVLLRVDRILSDQGMHEPHEVLARTYLGIPVASAQQANVMAGIGASLTSSFPAAVQQVLQIFAGEAAI